MAVAFPHLHPFLLLLVELDLGFLKLPVDCKSKVKLYNIILPQQVKLKKKQNHLKGSAGHLSDFKK